MECSYLYQFFNNASVAVIIAIGLGALIAVYQYKKQKQLDRVFFQKQELISNLILLKEKLQYALFILDRAGNTYKKYAQKKGVEEIKKFIDAFGQFELPLLSKALNNDIPLADVRITSLLYLYFPNQKEIIDLHNDFKNKLKRWHDFVLNNIPSKDFNFTQKTSEVLELNIEEIEELIKKLIDKINTI